MKNYILIILICVFQNMGAQNNQNEFDSIVNIFRIKYKVPAVSASVIKIDTILYGISGYKKYGDNDKIDKYSKFHLGSNTKAITSIIAAKLVEDGIVNWDSKLVDVVPELKKSIKKEYINITLEQLLSHRANIHPFEEDTSKEWRGIPKSISSEKNQKLAFTKYALNLNPTNSKESNHIYSNGGYIIAALILETKSGKTWEALVENLFKKTNIDYYIGFPSQKNTNDTYGHKKSGKKYKPIQPNKEYPLGDYFAPAGNISLNIVGFSKLIQLHLNGLMGDNNYITSNSYEKLHFGFEDYALGWYNGNIGKTEQKYSYHGGSLGTFSSMVIISPDRKIAIIILVNADNKQVNQLKNELREYFWDKYGFKF